MSKTIPAALLANYQSESPTVAHALKITRQDAEVFAFGSIDRDFSLNGVTYRADPGLDITNVQHAGGPQVGNCVLKAGHDGSVFTQYDVLSGIWNDATFILYRCNFAEVGSPLPQDVETVLVGSLGEITLGDSEVSIELRDLRQALQQPIGSPSTKTCRYRLGDARCGVNLSGNAPGSPTIALTYSGSVTAVDSAQRFSCSSATHPNDWFGAGELVWLTGANAGVRAVVKSFEQGSPLAGRFTLYLPMLAAILVGDTFTVTAGCRKRLEEDCFGKFSNVLNFGGEPHRPGLDATINVPTPNAG